MKNLREWIWAAVAAMAVNGYLPLDLTVTQSIVAVMVLWVLILSGIYFVEERMEKWARR